MFDCKVFIRVVELLMCIACVVALRVTDDESRRVFHYLRNRSREWSLLNNVTWGTIGAALATATCGGYVIITAGLLLAAATGELQGRKTEIFFLGLGIILFAIVGALSLASIESVPDTLIDNAAVLGGLCLLTALVFIVDLLLKPRKDQKHKQSASQTFVLKDNANNGKPTPAVFSSEKESHSVSPTTAANGTSNQKHNSASESPGNINPGFEKVEKAHREIEKSQVQRSDRRSMAPKGTDENTLERAERQFREYTRKFEDFDNHAVVFKSQDIYQRPVDEVDTPRFPSHFDRKSEPMFGKIVNPSVKIMRVERDTDDGFENYRYSDSSQYDNVPTRMRGGTSPGILKKSRPDVTYNVSSKEARQESERTIDEIEMLEECFGVLRPKVTTGTQTGAGNSQIRTPSSPTDPGYVRHTANNWPKDFKTKSAKTTSVD